MSSPLVCVIPAYNAADTVARVIAGVRASLGPVAIVGIDDGSVDRTGDELRAHCDRAIVFAGNRGKGAALQAGFLEAIAIGGDVVLTIDADGQHDPTSAPRLITALVDADIVVGSRTRAGTMPMRRRLTNALSAAATRRRVGSDVADPQSGFRAMRTTVLRAVHAVGDRYEFETDFLIRAARAGFRIASVPVPTIYGPPSHFREVRDGLRVVATFCRHARGAVS